jgi:thioredoxin
MDGKVIRCTACGQANRVPELPGGRKAVCGSCRKPLDDPRTPVVLTDATFSEAIRRGSHVVDFWAAWCGPCRTIAPILDELAQERTDVVFGKLNVDENPRTSSQFGVQGIPLLIFFRDGEEKGRVVGAVPRAQIEAAIQRHLG